MSKITDFFRQEGTDDEDRTIDRMLAWDDVSWELSHDSIQWLFPLKEPSRFNPDAPLLTDEDIALFKADPVLQESMRATFRRWLEFVGLKYENGEVVQGRNWTNRKSVWMHFNHNWLRVTRVLSCLHTLGLQAEADAFFEQLRQMLESSGTGIDTDTFQFWTEAVKGIPFHRRLG
jgi:hypothetical protein